MVQEKQKIDFSYSKCNSKSQIDFEVERVKFVVASIQMHKYIQFFGLICLSVCLSVVKKTDFDLNINLTEMQAKNQPTTTTKKHTKEYENYIKKRNSQVFSFR